MRGGKKDQSTTISEEEEREKKKNDSFVQSSEASQVHAVLAPERNSTLSASLGSGGERHLLQASSGGGVKNAGQSSHHAATKGITSLFYADPVGVKGEKKSCHLQLILGGGKKSGVKNGLAPKIVHHKRAGSSSGPIQGVREGKLPQPPLLKQVKSEFLRGLCSLVLLGGGGDEPTFRKKTKKKKKEKKKREKPCGRRPQAEKRLDVFNADRLQSPLGWKRGRAHSLVFVLHFNCYRGEKRGGRKEKGGGPVLLGH